MRQVRLWAMYALYLLYGGILVGIWPAGAIALVAGVLTTDHRFLVPTFFTALCLFTLLAMWGRHMNIWRSRRTKRHG